MVDQKKNSSSKKKVILCFIKYYLPGYRSGGPVRSIVNFVEKFSDVYDIRIVCLSHDAIDNQPYDNIIINEWNQVGKAKVFYVSNNLIKFKKIFDLLNEPKYDVIYLNSFFTFTFSIFPLLLKYFKFIDLKSCIIAPRGQFSVNAIKIKKIKKLIYIFFAKTIGLYKNVCWQASSKLELDDIKRVIGVTARNIQIVPDLNFLKWSVHNKLPYQRKDILKIVFLSRISPMKNLDFLINILAEVSYPLELSILGPKEDLHYWDVCKKLMDKLPNYIKVNIGGEVFPEEVQETFSKYDLFVFPTRGENFGHVIPEALSAGIPILLSDQTPWQKDASLGLQIIPLQRQKWVKAIEEWINLSDAEILKRRNAIKNYFDKITLENEKSILLNKQLFENN